MLCRRLDLNKIQFPCLFGDKALKLLAIVGSQRMNGNSYLLAREVLDSVDADYEIVQLAEKHLEFCTICGECVTKDCVLDDDFDVVFGKMKDADGIVFSLPKYLLVASKFLCFLERLCTVWHMRKHGGYRVNLESSKFELFSGEKPFCMFVVSGTGEVDDQMLKVIAHYIEASGLKLVPHDKAPFLAVNVKAGDDKGEVLKNKEAIEDCKRLTRKVLATAYKP